MYLVVFQEFAFYNDIGCLIICLGEVKMLNKMNEDALKIILGKYDGNDDLVVGGGYDIFPKYMIFSLKEIFNELKSEGLIAGIANTLTGWCVYLTPSGISYFEEKKRNVDAIQIGFRKLSANSKKLLDDILKAENPTQLLCSRLESASEKDDNELRSLIRELTNEGYINIPQWGDDMPTYVEINNSARTYDERLAEYERYLNKKSGITYNIGSIYSQNGILAIGDFINSEILINNSIERVENEIESKHSCKE